MRAEWAAELETMAREGGRQPATPYDAARYARLAVLAGEMRAALAADRSEAAVAPSPLAVAALAARTPVAAAEAAIFTSRSHAPDFGAAGRGPQILLIRRADSGLWALPGGAADVGDLPAGAAEREAWEETGLRVRAECLVGAYTRPGRRGAAHLWVAVYLCRWLEGQPVVTHETLDVGFFAQAGLPPLHGGHSRRIADAFAALAAGPAWRAIYD